MSEAEWVTVGVASVAPGLMAGLSNGNNTPVVALLHQERAGNPQAKRVVAGILASDGEVVPAVTPVVDFTVANREPWVPREDSPAPEPVVIPAPAGLFVKATAHDIAYPIVAFRVARGDLGVEVTPVGLSGDGSTGPVGGSRRVAADWLESAESADYA